MKIILQHQGKMASDLEERTKMNGDMDEELALDSSAFDVPGWVSIEVGGVSVSEVHISDLAAAVAGLQKEYEIRTAND